jgi:uncharacterized protein YciW
MPGDCTGVPEGPTFASILCHLDALRARVASESGLGAFRAKLAGGLERATKRATEARDLCGAPDLKKARQRLKQVGRALTQYAHRLAGHAARKAITPQLRQELVDAGTALKSDVVALRKALSCPADAGP